MSVLSLLHLLLHERESRCVSGQQNHFLQTIVLHYIRIFLTVIVIYINWVIPAYSIKDLVECKLCFQGDKK